MSWSWNQIWARSCFVTWRTLSCYYWFEKCPWPWSDSTPISCACSTVFKKPSVHQENISYTIILPLPIWLNLVELLQFSASAHPPERVDSSYLLRRFPAGTIHLNISSTRRFHLQNCRSWAALWETVECENPRRTPASKILQPAHLVPSTVRFTELTSHVCHVYYLKLLNCICIIFCIALLLLLLLPDWLLG